MYKTPEVVKERIRSLSKDDFRNANPFEKRSCADCKFIKEALSLWCCNKNAIKQRGTSIPVIIFCPWWKPKLSRHISIFKIVVRKLKNYVRNSWHS